jgi:hypothetical protein
MADETDKEFATYRDLFEAEEEKVAFDKQVKILLETRGVDYTRGYVDALRDILKRTGR